MKYIISCVVLIFFSSCVSFSRFSTQTDISLDEGYVTARNKDISFKSHTFGDFKFARNVQEYKKLNDKKHDRLKNILLYAKTEQPDYEYYILHNPTQKKFNTKKFFVKDTVIANNNFVLLISKNAPQADINFIKNNILYYK